ncbi:MAG: DNA polymerase III subunit delta' [Thermodesulfobacteriota bacterium]
MEQRIRDILDRLGHEPPQVLLFEGGTADDRQETALYWAQRLNCASGSRACGECPACGQIAARVFRDLFVFDGREGSIKVDEVREAIPVFSQAPAVGTKRAVLFLEGQMFTEATANTLLKSLEEPNPATCFALTAPQRERLLPTLVSRSWVLTLSWPAAGGVNGGEWVEALREFARTGKGWFSRTAGKGAVDRSAALAAVLACQADLARAMRGQGEEGLAGELGRALGAEGLRKLDLALGHAQDALTLPTPVNPALVLDWLATRVRSWVA